MRDDCQFFVSVHSKSKSVGEADEDESRATWEC